MTPEQKRIAIAEACGIEVEPCTCTASPWRDAATKKHLPDYLNDLNAMHEAERAAFGNNWDEEPWARYKQNLYEVIEMHRHVLNATAAQRAEAFLRTIGKRKSTSP